MSKEFEMKDLGEAKKILGMEINRDKERGKLWLSKKQYLKRILQRFGMYDDTKPVNTPLAPHLEARIHGESPICKCGWKLDVRNGVYKT